MSTLWNKGVSAEQIVERFTIGDDNILDLRFAKYDVIGSKAHIAMLKSVGLLKSEEEEILQKELNQILEEILEGYFTIEEGVEDIHSQVELTLTKRVGELGKKIHSGRSRNDQVLVDLKLFLKDEIISIKDQIVELFTELQSLSEQYKDVLLPGYTHEQIAMPSSFGLWFGAYAESLAEDMNLLLAAYKVTDNNPLGSAAGYGSSFPLDREMTTNLLGFSCLNYNSIAAQLSRGKCELSLSYALASFALTINKLSSDCCKYMCTNYSFISFPDELTTGSSIMPHKKNPDVWELIRAKCNRIQSTPGEISMICTNMTSGYHRDFQLLKEVLFPTIERMKDVIKMACYMISNIKINKEIITEPKYSYLFTVEEVNKRVLAGVPFRDAYRSVGEEVNNHTYKADLDHYDSVEKLHHTHCGSIGNLCNEKIKEKMDLILKMF